MFVSEVEVQKKEDSALGYAKLTTARLGAGTVTRKGKERKH